MGPKRDEEVGDWRTLHIEVVHDLYPLPNIVRVSKSTTMRWEGHVARIGEMRNTYRTVIEKPEGKRLLDRPSHKWEVNIKVEYT